MQQILPPPPISPSPDTVRGGALPVLLGLLALLLCGCSKPKNQSQEESCNERWDELKKKYDRKKYADVRDPLGDLVTSCPGSAFTEEALFTLAESHFNLKDWLEAQSEYSAFLREFPNSVRFAETARYRLAVAAAKQVLLPARDQQQTRTAIQEFENFLASHEESRLADSAKAEVDRLRKQLARKELQTARLYRRMNEPQAAAIYYKSILEEFPSHVDVREINLQLAGCYAELEQFDEAASYLAKFDGIAKDDPFRQKVRQAFEDLDKKRKRSERRRKKEAEEPGPGGKTGML